MSKVLIYFDFIWFKLILTQEYLSNLDSSFSNHEDSFCVFVVWVEIHDSSNLIHLFYDFKLQLFYRTYSRHIYVKLDDSDLLNCIKMPKGVKIYFKLMYLTILCLIEHICLWGKFYFWTGVYICLKIIYTPPPL